MEFLTTMGLEVHCELSTKTKFSAPAQLNSAESQTHTYARYAPVCPAHFPYLTNRWLSMQYVQV